MGVKNLPYIQDKLVQFGKSSDTPVAVNDLNITERESQVIGTLSTISDIVKTEKIENPCMIIVGEVVKMREKIKWFEKMNLSEVY